MSPRKNPPYLRVQLGSGSPEVMGLASTSLGQENLPEPLSSIHDVVCKWDWDGTQVVVRNCRLGFLPVYYFASKDVFAVSTSIEKLLQCGASSELDDVAMATLLRLGFVVGDDTVFKSIRMVPPDGEVRWCGGDLQVRAGYVFPRRQELSHSAAIEGYGELFRQAMRRRVAKEVTFGLPLSGGRDSRHILLELIELGVRPEKCFTNHDFPPYRTEDIRVGRLLAQRFELPHQVLGQPGSRLVAELRKNRANAYCATENIWAVNLYRTIANYTPIVYEGTAGDVISGGSYLRQDHSRLYEEGRLEELSRHLVSEWFWRGSEETLARVLTSDAIRRFSRSLAVERITKELERHTSAANPLTSFYFWNRTRRVAAPQPFSIAREAGVTAITPYLDHDVIDFLAALPPDHFFDKTFHTKTIERMHPNFGDIPYASKSDLPFVEGWLHYQRFLAEFVGYVAGRSCGRLVRKGPALRGALGLMLSASPNLRMRMSWIAPYTVLYMTQLEKLCSKYE